MDAQEHFRADRFHSAAECPVIAKMCVSQCLDEPRFSCVVDIADSFRCALQAFVESESTLFVFEVQVGKSNCDRLFLGPHRFSHCDDVIDRFRSGITDLDILAAAELALPHRLKRQTFHDSENRLEELSPPLQAAREEARESGTSGASMSEPSAGKKKT